MGLSKLHPTHNYEFDITNLRAKQSREPLVPLGNLNGGTNISFGISGVAVKALLTKKFFELIS